ncbi:MAG: hypothetical protein JNK65_08725, partial [Deltaproteobacteria bacterium]|nr:hypothetical protein [Deltaproteobacteria bacterium]
KCSFCGGKCATVPAGFVAKVLKLPLPKKKAAAISKKTTVKMIKKVEKKVARGGKKGR